MSLVDIIPSELLKSEQREHRTLPLRRQATEDLGRTSTPFLPPRSGGRPLDNAAMRPLTNSGCAPARSNQTLSIDPKSHEVTLTSMGEDQATYVVVTQEADNPRPHKTSQRTSVTRNEPR